MRSVERLEQFWRNLISEQKLAWGTNVNGAVVAYYPAVPIYSLNHAADISVNGDEAENVLNKVTEHFLSREIPFVCFRVSPLTRPESFTSFLEDRGFERKAEASVMVFKRKRVGGKVNPEVEVKEISESEIGVWTKLLLTIFEMPIEWKEGFDRLMLERKRKGGKCYLAYVEGKPVGICLLLSSMKTGGIFGVGTLKEYRRRGIGTTLTLHAVMDSINEGNDLHTLQAEKGGHVERLYRKTGFEIDHTISYFVKKFHGEN